MLDLLIFNVIFEKGLFKTHIAMLANIHAKKSQLKRLWYLSHMRPVKA